MSFWTTDSTNPTDPRGGFTNKPDFGIVTEQPDMQFPGGTSCYYPNGSRTSAPAMVVMDDDD